MLQLNWLAVVLLVDDFFLVLAHSLTCFSCSVFSWCFSTLPFAPNPFFFLFAPAINFRDGQRNEISFHLFSLIDYGEEKKEFVEQDFKRLQANFQPKHKSMSEIASKSAFTRSQKRSLENRWKRNELYRPEAVKTVVASVCKFFLIMHILIATLSLFSGGGGKILEILPRRMSRNFPPLIFTIF